MYISFCDKVSGDAFGDALASALASALGCGRSGEGEGELELEELDINGGNLISGVPGAFGGVAELDGAGDDVPDSRFGVEGGGGGGWSAGRGRTLR